MSDRRRVVVLGDVIDDIVVVPTGPIRSNTDTSASIRHSAGGSASNTAVWLASIGAAVDFVGSVGVADAARHASAFEAAGVTSHLAGHALLPTGTIVVLVDGQTRSFLTERGANSALDPDAVTDSMLDAAALVHLTGYSVMDAVDATAVPRLIRRARDHSVDVSVDPGSAGNLADFGASRFLDAIAGATVLFPNLDEGRVLTDQDDPRAIASALADRVETVALTMAHEGVLLAAGDSLTPIEPVPASIVDPTGAGDAFSAGFIGSWIADRDPVAACRAGAALAARAVTVMGGRPRPASASHA